MSMLACATLTAACSLSAKPQQEARFTSDVALVNVDFTVRDASGALKTDLKASDVEVYENGVKQEIRFFSRDEQTALNLALVLDRSGSQSDLEDENFQTAIDFLRRILRRGDRALAVGFGNRIKLLEDFTSDARELELALLDAGKIYDSVPRLGPAVSRDGGTAVDDAVFWTARERFNDAIGRKAIIMIGDGEENSSQYTTKIAIDELRRTGVLFYGLNNGGNTGKRRHRANVMPYLAEGSGGREFRAGSGSWKEAFAQIEAELRGLYTLAYAPSGSGKAGEYHKIEVRPLDRTLTARGRPGYFSR